MCGLVGIINKNQTFFEDKKVLKGMIDTIHHRGPDQEGIFSREMVGLGHKRLSIIDLEAGGQPMESKGCIIVFNGEIYNYIELRQQLIQKGHSFSTFSDTEVILKMYQEFGEDAISMLNGMFAFLLYDTRIDKLFAVRDHFGIKPLYYFENDSLLLFASEIKAILFHPEVKADVNINSLNNYLTFQFIVGEGTLYKHIKKVLPGHYLSIDTKDGRFELKNYWEPNFKVDNYHTADYFIYELQRLIEDAVKIQLRSDVSLGTYLSGGMDSSLVTLLASRNLPAQLKTFTGAFKEGRKFDESEYAKIVADNCGAEMHYVYPTEQDFISLLPKLIYHLDEPVVGPGVFPQYMVSSLASEHVKVVLGGQGGDEIFGGYTRYMVAYLEQALKGAIFETSEEGEHIVSLDSIVPNLPSLRGYIPMMKSFFAKEAFEAMDRRYFHLIDRSENTLELFSADFQTCYDREKVFQNFQKLFNHPDTQSYYNKMTHFDLFGSLPGLLQVEDRVNMAVSLESRVPLLDRRIVDLVSSMPVSMKFKGAEMKHILKVAAKGILPYQILERKDKMGFPVPLQQWTKSKVGDFIRDVLLSKSSRERGIFNMSKIEDLIENERTFGRALWGALCLELWYKEFID